MKAFAILLSDIQRCPDHNMSVEHWHDDGTCEHERSDPKEGDIRVWWIPQVPMSPFYADVETFDEAKRLETILAAYDHFQWMNNIKPDYSNVGGTQVFEDGEWNDLDMVEEDSDGD